jgi:hypothetical protein
MKSDHPLFMLASILALGSLVFPLLLPCAGQAAPLTCEYDTENPSLDHAVTAFMDPALFDCAELEIRDVLAVTPLSDRETVARADFLLAGALFGRQFSADIPDSAIIEYLVMGFVAAPDWPGEWYFRDMPDFMDLVAVARPQADALLACPFDTARPSLEHAREMMARYDLYECAANETATAINVLGSAEIPDSSAIADAYFLLGQAYYGMNLVAGYSDSAIVRNLAMGFVYSPERQGNWLFANRRDFMNLIPIAEAEAEAIRGPENKSSIWKRIILLGGIGAAVAGVLVAVIGGGDSGDNTPVDSTIPYFPPPPPKR